MSEDMPAGPFVDLPVVEACPDCREDLQEKAIGFSGCCRQCGAIWLGRGPEVRGDLV